MPTLCPRPWPWLYPPTTHGLSPFSHCSNLAPARLDSARSASLPIWTRQRLRRLTARDSLEQVTELGINQAAVLDRRRVSFITVDASNQLPGNNFDICERTFARVLLLAVSARAV